MTPAMTPDLLARMGAPGPRYTSYPTADRFVEAFGPEDYRRALAARAAGPGGAAAQPLAVYLHIPFCESVCYYCACHKIVTRQHDRAAEYLLALDREIALHVDALGARARVSQVHFGGGSPTFLSDLQLARVVATLRHAFALEPGAEMAIEVDPRTVDPARLERLAALGFNRISFGVQDFDAAVQRAVHREQGFEPVDLLVRGARALGFRSVSVDLILGLPRQTPATFARTIAQVVALRPDRIALYAYAHLPGRFKPQRRIDVAELPAAATKAAMLGDAISALAGAGYEHIGMDHFALPHDALAIARRQGRLHRNFQGYCDQPDGDLIGLGVSAIGRVGGCYSQNAKGLDEYYDALHQGVFPVARGLAPTRDDLIRRGIVMALMCQGELDFQALSDAYLVDIRRAFAAELQALAPMAGEGLVELAPDGLRVTVLGWFFVRSIAMVFDRYLQADSARAMYSRVL
ncbi:oxygen-independent coproporphyrinogen III oxidase [Xylophilus sp. GOD-11R]|uniref:oxygen-independent coproporphyrinogen III oxidase n=1 Tax=Xylophilus sp. GOD-11R TaxID=3089814 RepID=UPI00298D1041|nr:oxygen-independent coproporphyrinogen III oxidase [Xylophilus sp. GOD-11R]WPB59385.1 oxygen-independent coproporphyrinogen III oxidase [Xylophilus sp. GOD-11R]